MSSIPKIAVRVNLGTVEIDDVKQHYRPDVDIFFYYYPSQEDTDREGWESVASFEHFGGEFKNIHKTPEGDWPMWVPHFDFDSEIDEAVLTDESYWISREGVVFGRVNFIPNIQNRFNTTAFPFDRQILNIQLLSNNCVFSPWLRKNDCPSQLKLFYEEWQIQGVLDALADTWFLNCVRMKIDADYEDVSSIANLFMYISRHPNYYAINICTMLFFIVMLIVVIPFFPYNESRFEFNLTLLLTQIAYRFVTQGMMPQTGYLMYLDNYMLYGFAILITRFALDAWLVVLFEVPEAAPGDDFRCGWRIYYNTVKEKLLLSSWIAEEFDNTCPSDTDSASCDALPHLPQICKIDIWGTIILLSTWIVLWILFFFPRLWRRKWKEVEKSIEDERLVTTVSFENGKWCVPDEGSRYGEWLHKHRKGCAVENIADLQEKFPMPNSLSAGPEGGRNSAVWRGWTAPADEFVTVDVVKEENPIMTTESLHDYNV